MFAVSGVAWAAAPVADTVRAVARSDEMIMSLMIMISFLDCVMAFCQARPRKLTQMPGKIHDAAQ
jgi:hypothetical protein